MNPNDLNQKAFAQKDKVIETDLFKNTYGPLRTVAESRPVKKEATISTGTRLADTIFDGKRTSTQLNKFKLPNKKLETQQISKLKLQTKFIKAGPSNKLAALFQKRETAEQIAERERVNSAIDIVLRLNEQKKAEVFEQLKQNINPALLRNQPIQPILQNQPILPNFAFGFETFQQKYQGAIGKFQVANRDRLDRDRIDLQNDILNVQAKIREAQTNGLQATALFFRAIEESYERRYSRVVDGLDEIQGNVALKTNLINAKLVTVKDLQREINQLGRDENATNNPIRKNQIRDQINLKTNQLNELTTEITDDYGTILDSISDTNARINTLNDEERKQLIKEQTDALNDFMNRGENIDQVEVEILKSFVGTTDINALNKAISTIKLMEVKSQQQLDLLKQQQLEIQKDLQKKIDDLNKEVGDLKLGAPDLNKTIQDLRKKEREDEAKRQILQQKIVDLEIALLEEQDQNIVIEDKLAKIREERNQLEDKNEELLDKLEDTIVKLKESNQIRDLEIERLNKDLLTLQQNDNNVDATIQQLRKDKVALQEERNEALEALNKEKQDSANLIVENNKTINKLNEDLTRSEQLLNIANQKVLQLQTQKDSLENENKDASVLIQQGRAESNQLILEKNQQIQQLNDDLLASKNKIADSVQIIENLTNEKTQLQTERDNARRLGQNESLEIITARDTKITELNNELLTLKNDNKDANATILRINKEKQALQNQNKDELNLVKENEQNLFASIDARDQQIELLEKNLKTLQDNNNNVDANVKLLTEQKAELEKQQRIALEASENAKLDSDKIINEKNTEIKKLNDDIKTLETNNGDVNLIIQKLQGEKNTLENDKKEALDASNKAKIESDKASAAKDEKVKELEKQVKALQDEKEKQDKIEKDLANLNNEVNRKEDNKTKTNLSGIIDEFERFLKENEGLLEGTEKADYATLINNLRLSELASEKAIGIEQLQQFVNKKLQPRIKTSINDAAKRKYAEDLAQQQLDDNIVVLKTLKDTQGISAEDKLIADNYIKQKPQDIVTKQRLSNDINTLNNKIIKTLNANPREITKEVIKEVKDVDFQQYKAKLDNLVNEKRDAIDNISKSVNENVSIKDKAKDLIDNLNKKPANLQAEIAQKIEFLTGVASLEEERKQIAIIAAGEKDRKAKFDKIVLDVQSQQIKTNNQLLNQRKDELIRQYNTEAINGFQFVEEWNKLVNEFSQDQALQTYRNIFNDASTYVSNDLKLKLDEWNRKSETLKTQEEFDKHLDDGHKLLLEVEQNTDYLVKRVGIKALDDETIKGIRSLIKKPYELTSTDDRYVTSVNKLEKERKNIALELEKTKGTIAEQYWLSEGLNNWRQKIHQDEQYDNTLDNDNKALKLSLEIQDEKVVLPQYEKAITLEEKREWKTKAIQALGKKALLPPPPPPVNLTLEGYKSIANDLTAKIQLASTRDQVLYNEWKTKKTNVENIGTEAAYKGLIEEGYKYLINVLLGSTKLDKDIAQAISYVDGLKATEKEYNQLKPQIEFINKVLVSGNSYEAEYNKFINNEFKEANPGKAATPKALKEFAETLKINGIMEKMIELQNAVNVSAGDIRDLKEQIKTLNQEVLKLQGLNTGLNKDITKLTSDLKKANEDLKKAEEDLAKAKEDLEKADKDKKTASGITGISVSDKGDDYIVNSNSLTIPIDDVLPEYDILTYKAMSETTNLIYAFRVFKKKYPISIQIKKIEAEKDSDGEVVVSNFINNYYHAAFYIYMYYAITHFYTIENNMETDPRAPKKETGQILWKKLLEIEGDFKTYATKIMDFTNHGTLPGLLSVKESDPKFDLLIAAFKTKTFPRTSVSNTIETDESFLPRSEGKMFFQIETFITYLDNQTDTTIKNFEIDGDYVLTQKLRYEGIVTTENVENPEANFFISRPISQGEDPIKNPTFKKDNSVARLETNLFNIPIFEHIYEKNIAPWNWDLESIYSPGRENILDSLKAVFGKTSKNNNIVYYPIKEVIEVGFQDSEMPLLVLPAGWTYDSILKYLKSQKASLNDYPNFDQKRFKSDYIVEAIQPIQQETPPKSSTRGRGRGRGKK